MVKKIGDLPDSNKAWTYQSTPPCYSPEHNFPNSLVLKPGIYEHTCPSCGKVSVRTIRPLMHLFHRGF